MIARAGARDQGDREPRGGVGMVNGLVKGWATARRAAAAARRPPRRRRARRSTPIPISPRARTILALVALVALVLLLRAAPSVLTIVLGGAALALLLSFPVRLLSHLMPRGFAILLSFLALLGLVIFALGTLVPLLVDQLTALILATPQIAQRTNDILLDLLRPMQERGWLSERPEDLIADLQAELFSRAQALAQQLLTSLVVYLSGAFNGLLQLFGIIFVAIYLLVDIRRFKAVYLHTVPARYRHDARELWDAFSYSLSRYLGGLAASLAAQGALAAVGLTILGVPYPVVLGAWMSVTAILPYIGAFLGAIPAVIIALFVSPLTALLTALLFLIINQIEGNFLTPRIQGQAVRVHPILVFLAVIAGGEIAGLLGTIFAVPAVAVLRVLFDFFRVRLRVQRPTPAGPVPLPAPTAPPPMVRYTASPPPAEARRRGQDGG